MSTKVEKKGSLLPSLAFELLTHTEHIYKQAGKFPAETLQALHSVFGGVLVRAVELLEKGRVIKYCSENGRMVLKVEGHQEHYTLFPDVNFCHCQAFKFQVLQAREALTCKHVLAAKLASIRGEVKDVVVGNEKLVGLLNDQLER